MSGGADGLAKWHAYMASHGDLALLGAMVADGAVFHSPVVHTPQVGKAKVLAYLGAAAQVLGGRASRMSANWLTAIRSCSSSPMNWTASTSTGST